MNPAPMPFVIEYVNGMRMKVRKQGMASSWSSQGMSRTCVASRKPTTTSAGDAASYGTTSNSGVRNSAPKNKRPVTTDAKPVRAPSATPAVDSMYDVFDDPDAAPPATAASESTSSTASMFGT